MVDRWGIPVLRFHWKWSDYEYKQSKHMQETFRGIIAEMGGTPTSAMPGADQHFGLAAGGQIIHEAGATRMGNDRRTAVLNSHCQAHDVKNLFVVDASFFPSSAAVNPGLTIAAQALRVADHIRETHLA